MTDTRPPPMFLAESTGLDFLNSWAIPFDVEVEWLERGSDLLAWLQAAGLVTAAIAAEVKKTANPGELDAVAAQARALREWFRTFVAAHRGKPLTRKAVSELEPLNRLLARDQEHSQIVPRAAGSAQDAPSVLALETAREWRSPEALLFPIAKAMAQLLTDADFTYVKLCEGPNCVLHFLDTTRDHRRRWCSMAVCGNRAKQAALRSRRASSGQ